MDKIVIYREIIQALLTEIGSYKSLHPEIETQLLFDTTRDHYQILKTGWRDLKRTYGIVIHIDIVNGKAWIQQNATDLLIAEKLVERGIPKEDIVLGFHAPYKRQYTEFAAA
jgi:XisI protein